MSANRPLNEKQRIVIWAGLVLVLIMGFFPPWKYVLSVPSYRLSDMSGGGTVTERSAGYRLIFQSPSLEDTTRLSKLFGGVRIQHNDIHLRTQIDVAHLLVQYFIVVLVTCGLVFVLQSRRHVEE